jgi:IS5 family transposase
MAGTDRLDRAPLPQDQQEGWPASLSAGHDAEHPSTAAVVSLSDPAMEEALIEVPTMRRFAGIELISERIPDETTILTFCHLLKKHDLGEQIFETVKAHLSARGVTMRQGTIVDATLIAVPSSTKNKEGKRDPEMHQTKKGNQWYHRFAEGFAYGMKVHAGVDKDSGLIHSVVVTAANVHDLTPAAELLHGDD